MVPVAPIITGITFVFTFYRRCIPTVRSLYFRIFSASFLITFLSPEIATYINIHVLFSLSLIIMSGLLLGMVLSVCTCWFHNMVTLHPWLVSTDFGTCLYPLFNKNQAAWNFLSPELEVTWRTVAIIIRVVFSFPIFVNSWHFSVFHSLQSITPCIY